MLTETILEKEMNMIETRMHCDSPSCTRDAIVETGARALPKGWLEVTVNSADPKAPLTTVLVCSYRCLSDWAESMRSD